MPSLDALLRPWYQWEWHAREMANASSENFGASFITNCSRLRELWVVQLGVFDARKVYYIREGDELKPGFVETIPRPRTWTPQEPLTIGDAVLNQLTQLAREDVGVSTDELPLTQVAQCPYLPQLWRVELGTQEVFPVCVTHFIQEGDVFRPGFVEKDYRWNKLTHQNNA